MSRTVNTDRLMTMHRGSYLIAPNDFSGSKTHNGVIDTLNDLSEMRGKSKISTLLVEAVGASAFGSLRGSGRSFFGFLR